MNKMDKVMLLTGLLITLAASSQEEATPTPAPTAEPETDVEEPTEAPAEEGS